MSSDSSGKKIPEVGVELLEAIVEQLPHMIFVKEAEELRFIRFNKAGEDLLGYSRSEMLGKNDRDLFPADEAEFFIAKDREVLEQRGLVDIREEPIHSRTKGLRWLHTKKIPILDSSGSPLYLLGISEDITDSKRVGEQLAESEARFRRMAEQFPGVLWTTDEELCLTSVAGSLSGDLFDDPISAIGSHVVEVLRDCQSTADLEHQHRIPLSGESASFELRRRGRIYVVEVQHLERGDARGTIAVALDVTERRRLEAEQLEERLVQAQKLESLGILAGGIAHDFNNLLVGILGGASFALMMLPNDSSVRRPLEEIQASAQRAAVLTRQMLAYAGKGKVIVEEVDISRVVDEIAKLLEAAISQKAEFEMRLSDELPTIAADVAQVQQLVMNLITNAADAVGHRGGTITVTTRIATVEDLAAHEDFEVENDFVVLEVRDDGCGMDEHTRAHMFDPFFTTKEEGHGLGLAAAGGIVRSQGGRILVESRLERGTTVSVLLPASAGSADAGLEPGASPPKTVLIVDDEGSIRRIAELILKNSGFQVETASSGELAVEAFAAARRRPDLVLLDMRMPGLSGEETLRELRRVDEGIRILLSSGYDAQEAEHRFADDRLVAFIQKPYTADKLQRKVAALLESGSAPERANPS